MTRPIRYAALLTCFAALLACNRDRSRDNREGTTTVTGANVPSVANATALNRIVEAQCARQLTCNNIGNDKKYASRDVCMQKVRADLSDDLDAKECARGIAQKQLDACVSSINAENCDNLLDTIERVTACRKSELCLK